MGIGCIGFRVLGVGFRVWGWDLGFCGAWFSEIVC